MTAFQTTPTSDYDYQQSFNKASIPQHVLDVLPEIVDLQQVQYLNPSNTNKCVWPSCNALITWDATSQNLKAHLIQHHGMTDYFPLLKCGHPECAASNKRPFTTWFMMLRHINKVHWQLDKLVCPKCKQPLAGEENLVAHLEGVHHVLVANRDYLSF